MQRDSGAGMAESIRCACLRVAHVAGFVVVSILSLLWSTAAYAQSREDQYGSPTGPVDYVGRALDTLGVLPETGGPLILLPALHSSWWAPAWPSLAAGTGAGKAPQGT
jgi:hypothetical protein